MSDLTTLFSRIIETLNDGGFTDDERMDIYQMLIPIFDEYDASLKELLEEGDVAFNEAFEEYFS